MNELQNTYRPVLAQIRTLEELRILHQEIDVLLGVLFQIDEKLFTGTLKQHIRPAIANALLINIQSLGISLTDHKAMQQYLTDLKSTLLHLPVVTLVLAIPPSHPCLVLLSDTVRATVAANAVLKITFDPEIMGGAAIIYNGKYIDLTLKTKIRNTFEKKEEEIRRLMQ